MGCCGDDDSDQPSKFDPDFKGPLEKRHCTDRLWLLLFIVFWVGMIVVASFGLSNGDPRYLTNGHDSFGNICGIDNSGSKPINNTNSGLDMSNRSKVFYFSAAQAALDGLKICVPACPETTSTTQYASYQALGLCLSDANGGPYTYDTAEDDNSNFKFGGAAAENGCPISVFASTSFMNRCIPIDDAVTAVQSIFSDINADGVAAEIVTDLENSWEVIVYLCLISAAIAMLIVFLMRIIAYVLIWVVYWLSYVAVLALTVFLWYTYKTQKDNLDGEATTDGEDKNLKWYFYGAIAWTVIGVILICILVFMYSRIKLTIALFREASTCILHMPLLVLTPFWIFALLVLLVVYFVFVWLYLYTSADVVENSNNHAEFDANKDLMYMQWYHIFGGLWTMNVILAFSQCGIAGAVATYFFTRDKKKLGSPILGGFYRAIRYHLGSLAFGAFIIAVVQLMRLILEYIDRKTKDSQNSVAKFIMKCLKCCLWCFEKCLKFLNRNAYIEIAIFGHSFCTAARKAFFLLLRNAARVFAINSVGDFVIFLGKLIIVVLCAIVATIWVKRLDDVTYWAIPVLVVSVAAWMIASIFFSVYEMTIDTLFICFVEDSERNDGTADKPYFMSKNLLRLLSKKSRNRQKATEAGAAEDPPYDKAKSEEQDD